MAVMKWPQATGRQRQHSAGIGLVVLMLVLLILILGVTACAPAETSPEKAIVGNWVNAQGGEIYFYADNTGFIPGLAESAESIPDYKFTYSFQDKTHLRITLEGQPAVVVEIKIEGDKLTWGSQHGNPEYVYTRAK